MEGTTGWSEALLISLRKYGMGDIYQYYTTLAWYDSDLFDDQLGNLLIEKELINEPGYPFKKD